MWVLLARFLIPVGAIACQLAITSALHRRAKRSATKFHIMLAHWLLWGPVLAFGWSLQWALFASPSQRMGVAPVLIWGVVGGLSLICLGLGLAPGAFVEDMPFLEVCIHPPEDMTFQPVLRGRAFWAIMSVSMGLGALVYSAVVAVAAGAL